MPVGNGFLSRPCFRLLEGGPQGERYIGCQVHGFVHRRSEGLGSHRTHNVYKHWAASVLIISDMPSFEGLGQQLNFHPSQAVPPGWNKPLFHQQPWPSCFFSDHVLGIFSSFGWKCQNATNQLLLRWCWSGNFPLRTTQRHPNRKWEPLPHIQPRL